MCFHWGSGVHTAYFRCALDYISEKAPRANIANFTSGEIGLKMNGLEKEVFYLG